MTGPFGVQPPDYGAGFGGYPPPAEHGAYQSPSPAYGGQSVLATIAVVVGVCALLLAFVPYYLGLVAAAAGIGGLAVGIVALVRRGTGGLGLPLAGTVTSALAVVMGIVMTIVYTSSGTSTSASATESQTWARHDTETVLSKELEVTFGEFTRPTGQYTDDGGLPVTLKSRLSEARDFFVTVGAFDGDTQLGSQLANETLNSGQSRTISIFDKGELDFDRLKNAEFRVIEASSFDPE